MDIPQQKLFGMIQSGLNLITQAISIHDQDLRLVHANQRFQTMFQLPNRLIQPGAEFRDILLYLSQGGEYGPIENIASFVDEKVALARKFEPHYFERTRSNGTSISVEGSPLDNGGWISVYSDITDVKRQEVLFKTHAADLSKELVERSKTLAQTNRELSATIRALETAKLELTKSRERLDLINRMTPAHIAHVDAEGIYTHSNGRLRTIIPFAQSSIVGMKFKEVLGEDIWEHIEPRFQKVLGGAPSVSEFRDEHSGRFVRLAMSPDFDNDGQVQGAYILSTDVTEETVARHALTHARRKELAAQLTSVMAHDFSNLLTIIMGQQDRLENVATHNPMILDISETIKTAARRGRDLIENLNQMDAERGVDPVLIKFEPFADGLEQLIQAATPENLDLNFSVNVPDDNLILDPGFAQDAILNLAINAAEACGPNGKISISLAKSGNSDLEFLVTDTGPGFSEKALSNALNPFFSTKGDKVGRGLGLTSAFDFAKSCGGNLRIRNAKTGGAEVSIKIPYQAAQKETGHLVLLVDDNNEVRETVRSYLRRAGHSVIEASSAEEAGQLMSIEGLSQVITDLDLGHPRTGLEVVSLVPDGIPTLVITGLPASDPRRLKAASICKILSKPFGFDDLQRALSRNSA